MSSLLRSTREVSNNTGYYIPIADIRGSLLSYTESLSQLSTASWANRPPAGEGYASSLVAFSTTGPTGLLRDMGKTLYSSLRVFRRVQLVVPNYTSTFGVGGGAATTYPNSDYLTAYIELGFEGGGTPARVAQFGR